MKIQDKPIFSGPPLTLLRSHYRDMSQWLGTTALADIHFIEELFLCKGLMLNGFGYQSIWALSSLVGELKWLTILTKSNQLLSPLWKLSMAVVPNHWDTYCWCNWRNNFLKERKKTLWDLIYKKFGNSLFCVRTGPIYWENLAMGPVVQKVGNHWSTA